jgi:hypothetical protein
MPIGRSLVNPNQNSVPVATSGSISDFQSQMLTLLMETFSKMMTLSTDSKSEWPKFNGDSKKFWSWYLAVRAQLSLYPWLDLYDSTKNDIISTTQAFAGQWPPSSQGIGSDFLPYLCSRNHCS